MLALVKQDVFIFFLYEEYDCISNELQHFLKTSELKHFILLKGDLP